MGIDLRDNACVPFYRKLKELDMVSIYQQWINACIRIASFTGLLFFVAFVKDGIAVKLTFDLCSTSSYIYVYHGLVEIDEFTKTFAIVRTCLFTEMSFHIVIIITSLI